MFIKTITEFSKQVASKGTQMKFLKVYCKQNMLHLALYNGTIILHVIEHD